MSKRDIILRVAGEIGELTADKNEAYGDSFYICDQILQLLYPDGVEPSQYGDMLAITRVIDKIGRIANRKNAFGESPYRDLGGYGLIGAVHDEIRTAEDIEAHRRSE